MSDLNPRPIRVAPGVRERVVAEMESRPESAHAADARAERDYQGRHRMPEPCMHPGVFSMHVPGDPTRFNATEHCWHCDCDIPACEL